MKNKMLSYLLIFVMAVSLLTGCNGPSTEGNAGGTQQASQSEIESTTDKESETEKEDNSEKNTEDSNGGSTDGGAGNAGSGTGSGDGGSSVTPDNGATPDTGNNNGGGTTTPDAGNNNGGGSTTIPDNGSGNTGNNNGGSANSGTGGGTGNTGSNTGSGDGGSATVPDNGGENTGNNNGGSTNSGTGGGTGNTGSNTGSGTGSSTGNTGETVVSGSIADKLPITIADIPEYTGTQYIVLNNNNPFFSTENAGTKAMEYYSPLDSLKRGGMAYACLGPETIQGERVDIGKYKPSGWHQYSYPTNIVKGGAIYNRSHLIAHSLVHSLSGKDDTLENLITGTPQFNQINMQIFETMVLDYLKEAKENNRPNTHVLYRVTPLYKGNELVARGVVMEGWSVEDKGESICFNVFIYNAQNGVKIDYATGYNQAADGSCGVNANGTFTNGTSSGDGGSTSGSGSTGGDTTEGGNGSESGDYIYVVNTNSGKIHKATCGSGPSEANSYYCNTLEEALAKSREVEAGLEEAKRCHSCVN